MSSSMDAGHSAARSVKDRETECPRYKDKKHKFKRQGSGPSAWDECKCGMHLYYK